MPLLNKKRITFATPIDSDTRRRRKQVYFLKCTNEAFSTYESYIKRWTLCHRPLWECERTGRQHLTYQQAKESEQADLHRVEFKFCAVLRKQLLSHIQFQTAGLDALVQNLFASYLYDFATGEIILCFLGGNTYLGEILDIIPNPTVKEENGMPRQTNGRLRFPDAFLHPEPSPTDQSTGEEDPSTSTLSAPDHQYRYKVQLINTDGTPLEQSERVLEADEVCRDPQWFNPTMLRRLVRECATRDGYIGAPWLLKENVAKHYGIPTTLPTPLQETQDMAYYDLVRQRQPQLPLKYEHHHHNQQQQQQHHHHHHTNGNGITSSWSIHPPNPSPSLSPTTSTDPITFSSFSPYNQLVARDERREVDKQARKQEHLRLKIQQKLEKERIREERKKQAAVKYPIEDLDLPIYRKDPYRHWALVDMTPNSYAHPGGVGSGGDVSMTPLEQVRIPYPCGGRGPHPEPHLPSCLQLLSDQEFESMLAIWSFLTVFSVPLDLPTMTIESFESSLLSTTQLSNLIQSFVCLLNVIIKERLQGTTSDIINGDQVEDYLQDNESSDDDHNEENDEDKDNNENEDENVPKQQQRQKRQKQSTLKNVQEEDGMGWRDTEPLRLCKDWDRKEIRADRKNWLVALIGCLNDVATPLLLPGVSDLLNHLIPRPHSTMTDRDRQFASLDGGRRLQLLSFLVDATNETLIIKNYMDKCQDQMTELRRQKVELNKEYKKLALHKATSEKKQPGRKSGSVNETTDKKDTNDTTPVEDEIEQHTSDIDDDEDEEEEEEEENEEVDEEDDENDDDDDDDTDQTDSDDDEDDDDDDEEEEDDDFAMYNTKEPNEKHTGKRKSKYGLLHQSRRMKLDQKKQQQQQQQQSSKPAKRRRTKTAKTTKSSPKPSSTKDTSPSPLPPTQASAPATLQPKVDQQPLEDKETQLKQKEEQLEREMRQYMTLRIRPLGKDRFFQRYFYLDNIGTPDHHGTGRLYVQSPTYVDILQLMDRDHHPSSNGVVSGPLDHDPSPTNDPITPAWGRGGGREFVLALMHEQGLSMERDWLARRMMELQEQQDTLDQLRLTGPLSHPMCPSQPVLADHLHHQHQKNASWWYYYDDPEQIQLLLAWLNPKGVREYKLRNEIIKQQHYIVESMEKHDKVQTQSPAPSNRITRAKKP